MAGLVGGVAIACPLAALQSRCPRNYAESRFVISSDVYQNLTISDVVSVMFGEMIGALASCQAVNCSA